MTFEQEQIMNLQEQITTIANAIGGQNSAMEIVSDMLKNIGERIKSLENEVTDLNLVLNTHQRHLNQINDVITLLMQERTNEGETK